MCVAGVAFVLLMPPLDMPSLSVTRAFAYEFTDTHNSLSAQKPRCRLPGRRRLSSYPPPAAYHERGGVVLGGLQ